LGEEGLNYGSFDILSDDLKEYSNWSTYPQHYIKGGFICGCEIILEMHQNGELKELQQWLKIIRMQQKQG
jgi:glutaredoxin-related protein